jgi:hypothetical protein
MKVYTYSQARQNLATLLEQAAKEGEVWIKRQDGQVFAIRPEPRKDSPLDVKGADLGLTADEIVQFVRKGRRMTEWPSAAGQGNHAVAARPYAVQEDQKATYRGLAQDEERESDASEWAEGTLEDVSEESQS